MPSNHHLKYLVVYQLWNRKQILNYMEYHNRLWFHRPSFELWQEEHNQHWYPNYSWLFSSKLQHQQLNQYIHWNTYWNKLNDHIQINHTLYNKYCNINYFDFHKHFSYNSLRWRVQVDRKNKLNLHMKTKMIVWPNIRYFYLLQNMNVIDFWMLARQVMMR